MAVKQGTGADSMDYRKLGKTDLNLSLIGFGGAALGGVFGNVDPGEGMRAVHLAVDSGINFFDTSPYYGITLAETRLGRPWRADGNALFWPPSVDATE